IPIEEESNIEKRNDSSVKISLKSNYISNIFKDKSERRISRNNFKKYGEIINCNHSIAYCQKITNNIDYLLNEINLNLNHQNTVSQPT
ncbi:MAG: hypothetical protein WA143_01890, partial [Lutibacter sp.]